MRVPWMEKLTLGHLDKNYQKWPKTYPLWGSLFSRNRLFSGKKESTATQEEQGSKLAPKICVFFRTDFLYWKNRKEGFTKQLKIWWKFPMKNSDFGENLVARGAIYEPFLICVTPYEAPSEVHLFEKCWSNKSSKNTRKICFPKRSEIHFYGLGTLR